MSYVDIAILIIILLSALIGFKRGFTRELVSCVGFIVCLILAYFLKNPVSALMYEHLPFFSFGGIIKGVIVVNILVYEVLAFILVFFGLSLLLKVVQLITNIFEKILTLTIILGIPSKLLGMVLGAIKGTLISFIILFVLALPIFNTNYINESKICKAILNYTPILSQVTDKTKVVFDEFKELKDKYNGSDTNQFNLDALDLFLKYDIIDIDSADKLYLAGKFKLVNNVDEVLQKYRKG